VRPAHGGGGRTALLLLVCAQSACAGRGGSPPAATPTPAEADPPAVHWVRTSAEYEAIFEQVYRIARDRVLQLALSRPDGSWGVILDADETILDNSTYQQRRAQAGLGYTPESWTDWVHEEAAPALPGARDFVRTIQGAGGRVAVVTNRTEAECQATRRNLRAVDIEADVVLCRPPESGDKEPRFRAVQEGTTHAGLPPLEVLAWVGDNIQDFPDMTQDLWGGSHRDFEPFGSVYFVLPNPMYGSWQRNPQRAR